MAHVPGYVITTEEKVIKRQLNAPVSQETLRQIASLLGVSEVPDEDITKILVGTLKLDLT